jgi:hypothetical protein
MSRRFSTGRLAQASARHPWRVVSAWVAALVAAAVCVAALMGGALTTDDDSTGTPESKRADALIEQLRQAPVAVDPGRPSSRAGRTDVPVRLARSLVVSARASLPTGERREILAARKSDPSGHVLWSWTTARRRSG